jgi:hypothetical protein
MSTHLWSNGVTARLEAMSTRLESLESVHSMLWVFARFFLSTGHNISPGPEWGRSIKFPSHSNKYDSLISYPAFGRMSDFKPHIYLLFMCVCVFGPQDRQFGKLQLFTGHKNPPAKVESNIKSYGKFSLQRAYEGKSYFWGLGPDAGDTIQFIYDPPIHIKS